MRNPKLHFNNFITLEYNHNCWVFSPRTELEAAYMLEEAYMDNELFESELEMDLIKRYE
jgi:hypothetical protein